MKIENQRATLERNIAMELVRVTESAALASARYLGMGDKNLVDQAAVNAMRMKRNEARFVSAVKLRGCSVAEVSRCVSLGPGHSGAQKESKTCLGTTPTITSVLDR